MKTLLPVLLLSFAFATRATGQEVELSGRGQFAKERLDSTRQIAFCKSVFNALKTGDLANYLALLPSREEYPIVMSLAEQKVNNVDSMLTADKVLRTNEFKRLLASAKKERVDWKSAEFVDYLIRTILPSNYNESIFIGHVNFTSDGTDNKNIFGIQAIEIDHRYKLLKVQQILPGRMMKFVDLNAFEFRPKK